MEKEQENIGKNHSKTIPFSMNLEINVLNDLDYLFFKGNHDSIYENLLKIEEQVDKNSNEALLINFFIFRFILMTKGPEPFQTELKTRNISNKHKITLEEYFLLEIQFYTGANKNDLVSEFSSKAQLYLRSNLPAEMIIHFLQIGAIINLDLGGNPYETLQYAQLASSFAQKLINKEYYYAWTLARQGQAFWVIGNLFKCKECTNQALEIFDRLQTGEFLGRFAIFETLIHLEQTEGNFEKAIELVQKSRTTLPRYNFTESLLLEIDLHLNRGSLDQARDLLYDYKFYVAQKQIEKRDFRIKLREARLLIKEGKNTLAARQLELLINSKLQILDELLKFIVYGY